MLVRYQMVLRFSKRPISLLNSMDKNPATKSAEPRRKTTMQISGSCSALFSSYSRTFQR